MPSGFLHRFLDVARRHPEAIAIEMLEGGARVTYAELRARAELVCGALGRLGVGPGDRVLLMLPNGIPFVAAYLASVGRGAVPVLVSDKLTGHELAALAARSAPRLVVTTAKLFAAHAATLRAVSGPCAVATIDRPPAIDPPLPFALTCLDDGEAPEPLRAPDGDPIATIQYTYKGLGVPLEVAHRYRAFSHCIDGIHEELHAQGVGSTILVALPLHAVFGLTILMLLPLSVGARMLVTSAIARHDIVQLLARHRVTFACLVPDLMRFFLAQLRRRDGAEPLPQLEPKLMVYSGGSHLSGDLAADLGERLDGRPVLQGYGLTESMPILLQSSHRSGTAGALGRPIRCIETRIVDGDGREVSPGQTGELLARGPTITAGYVGDPRATGRFFRDGWLHTGDLVARSADGEVSFVGRRLRITKITAQMVDLGEVESAAALHPAVRRARAWVARDAQGRNMVRLSVAVSGRPASEAIAAHLSERLSPFKLPRSVELVAAGDAP
jgi:long-chain acyl-CoA synthetase